LLNPTCPYNERNEVLASLCEMAVQGDEQFRNFFVLLADNKRLEALPSISSAFNSLLEALKRELSMIVTSAIPLSAEEKTAFETTAKDKFGTLVSVQWKENSEKIGGMVVQIGDKILDGSVKGVLEKLKETLVH
jgi:F-type H+-transporting ATPase subunit delta